MIHLNVLRIRLTKKINHPFRYTYKFICYDIDVRKNEIVEDKEEFQTRLQVINDATFESNNNMFNKKLFTGYNLLPEKTTSIQSMEIIVLKSFLMEVLLFQQPQQLPLLISHQAFV